ncbi:MAG TPA: thioredoxin domain-containing protein [Candidatus Angelobacter sp.]|jgi:protein-disulfide isomerase|nr:thioredoxin domain-containing protein [Candidatus Angelobacter sp.]
MIKLKIIALMISLAVSFAASSAQSAAPKKAASKPATPAAATAKPEAALPTTEDVDAALKRTLGYDPGVTWQIYEIKPAAVPGLADVLFAINKQAAQHIYLSTDAQNAIIGEMIPFGANPFAPARAKLKGAFGPSRGGPNPAIDIVEFSDLECPHCKKAQPILEKLSADFPQVRFIFQQFPLPASLHPWAMKAAQYADCAGQINKDAFWKYVDAIFENQGGIALATADDKLKELAIVNGLDAMKVAACADSPETAARIKKSTELGASLDVNETPTVFMNGRRVRGVADIPYDKLKELVQFEIDHAGK